MEEEERDVRLHGEPISAGLAEEMGARRTPEFLSEENIEAFASLLAELYT